MKLSMELVVCDVIFVIWNPYLIFFFHFCIKFTMDVLGCWEASNNGFLQDTWCIILFCTRNIYLGASWFFWDLEHAQVARKPQVQRFLAGFHLMFIYAAPVNRTCGSAYKSVGMLTKLWADCTCMSCTATDVSTYLQMARQCMARNLHKK